MAHMAIGRTSVLSLLEKVMLSLSEGRPRGVLAEATGLSDISHFPMRCANLVASASKCETTHMCTQFPNFVQRDTGGVQFPPVHLGGRTFLPSQGNNLYIFPAVGMAIYVTNAKCVTDEMFIEAARAVADQVTPEQLKLGMLFPPQSNILEVEVQTAARVAKSSSMLACPASIVRPTWWPLSGSTSTSRSMCRLQLNRRPAYFEVRFLRLNRRPTLLFAAKS
jgi:hypothetical protein